MIKSEQVLNQVGEKLARALRPDKQLNLDSKPAFAHGFYGFEPSGKKAMGDDWFGFAAEIGKALYAIHGYSFLDLGCNVGGKVPFFTAWGCKRYMGLEQMPQAVAFAKKRWANSFIDFQVCDIVNDEWPSGFDAMGITYVFQHVPLDSKRAILRKVAKANPRVFILADRSIRRGTLGECAAEVEKKWRKNMSSPYPLSELKELLPAMTVTEPLEHLFICRRAER
jgi:SAM-dependent methyltransferase